MAEIIFGTLGVLILLALLFGLASGAFLLFRMLMQKLNRGRAASEGENEDAPSREWLPDGWWDKLRTPLRVGMITLLAVLLLIPLAMVRGVVSERHSLYNGVLRDVGKQWGQQQTLTGPLLIVPYRVEYDASETYTDKEGKRQILRRQLTRIDEAVLLPDSLQVNGDMQPEYRKRGIYESLVYSMGLSLNGRFSDMNERIQSLVVSERIKDILWHKARLAIGLSDPKGIAVVSAMRWNDQALHSAPGTLAGEALKNGFHVPLSTDPGEVAEFALDMRIRGSHGFELSPVAQQTDMKLSANWDHPSFDGEVLPDRHEIEAGEGFSAEWSVPHLVRSYPQQWRLGKDSHSVRSVSMGVRLFEPVTLYTEATRAVKYGILFIGLTFVTLLLIEQVTGVRPGMVQYLMIGGALAIFYLLLIALAEHLGFVWAYLLASTTVIGLIGWYSLSILKRRGASAIVVTVMTALYGILYSILQAEDYALLTGTLLIAVTLAVGMVFTRKPKTIGRDAS